MFQLDLLDTKKTHPGGRGGAGDPSPMFPSRILRLSGYPPSCRARNRMKHSGSFCGVVRIW